MFSIQSYTSTALEFVRARSLTYPRRPRTTLTHVATKDKRKRDMCSLRDRLRLYVWFREEIAASATTATTTQPLLLIVPNEAHDSLLECLFKIPNSNICR